MKPSIEKAIQLLESAGYTVTKKPTPEEIKEINKALQQFEASNRQFPDELFVAKSSGGN
jgi:ABC-type transport system substrate-binding protein